MIDDQHIFLDRLNHVFKQEAKSRLDTMRLLLCEIESDEAAEMTIKLLPPLQMEVHSLKGAARSVELHDVELLYQDAETLLINMRRRQCGFSVEMVAEFRKMIEYLDAVVVQSLAAPAGISIISVQAALRAFSDALEG